MLSDPAPDGTCAHFHTFLHESSASPTTKNVMFLKPLQVLDGMHEHGFAL